MIPFGHLYRKLMGYEMKLPNAILTFTLLDGVNITDDERKLALTVCSELKFDRMKSSLKRLFSKSSLHVFFYFKKHVFQGRLKVFWYPVI